MKKLLLVAALLLVGSNVLADTLTETWDDPLGGWRDRWVAQNTNMTNYYVCTGGQDENYRGNNPCGIWICDSDQDYTTADITFDPTFGASITHLELGIQAFTTSRYTVYDMQSNVVFSTDLTTDYSSPYGCYCTMHVCDTPNGVSRFLIEPVGGGQIEGNTAVDNMMVITGQPVPVSHLTWGGIKALYR